MRRVLVPAAALLAAALLAPGAQACDGHGAKIKTKIETTSTEVRETRSAHLELAVSEMDTGHAKKAAGKTCSKAKEAAYGETCKMKKADAGKTCSKAKKAAAGKTCSKSAKVGSAGTDDVHDARLARIKAFAAQLRARQHGD